MNPTVQLPMLNWQLTVHYGIGILFVCKILINEYFWITSWIAIYITKIFKKFNTSLFYHTIRTIFFHNSVCILLKIWENWKRNSEPLLNMTELMPLEESEQDRVKSVLNGFQMYPLRIYIMFVKLLVKILLSICYFITFAPLFNYFIYFKVY